MHQRKKQPEKTDDQKVSLKNLRHAGRFGHHSFHQKIARHGCRHSDQQLDGQSIPMPRQEDVDQPSRPGEQKDEAETKGGQKERRYRTCQGDDPQKEIG